MSNVIEKLHELITPEILLFVKDEDGSDENKTNILGTLYSLLAVRLTDNETAERLGALDDESATNGELILSQLFQDKDNVVNGAGLLTTISQALGTHFGVAQNTASTLALAGLPLAYNQLKRLAGDVGVPAYLAPQKDGLVATLPTWLTALLPAGLLAGLGLGLSSAAAAPVNPLVEVPAPEPVPVAEPTPEPTPAPEPIVAPVPEPVAPTPTPAPTPKAEQKGGFLKGLLPFIGALIIGLIAWLMLKGCQSEPVKVAVPPPSSFETAHNDQSAVASILASLKLALNEKGDSLYAFDANVGGAGLGDELKRIVGEAFGNTDHAKINIGKGVASDMPILQYLPQVLGFMKGVPDASIRIEGKTIFINSSNPEALDKLLKDLRTALPTDFSVEVEPALNAEEAVAKSLDDAQNAMNALSENSSADELVRALNLQIINFASGSSDIPTANQAILDKASELMTKIPNVQLKIVGHTDNKGSMESNQKLSESRAKAVRDYLVSKGVSEALLSVYGASYTEPVASNATEQGRFANRRIEFALSQDGQTVAKVGNAEESATAKVEPRTEQASEGEAVELVASDANDKAQADNTDNGEQQADDNTEKSDKADKGEKSDKADKGEKSDKADKAEKADKKAEDKKEHKKADK